ncbi:TIGR04283 family arsenosugar biosynthesis glycosyltransferase [Kistimonas scapharcae]|uniref:TIGR04283 family arsenosugar biosynthesis glycosyltransferase n=1 Tax=Kistimonas scapharcae TaxID=1036133 RepID=A0ABP8V2D6_9GAMM
MKLSIIIPVLNEASVLRQKLTGLQCFRASGHELILVDGGSDDETISMAEGLADLVITSPKGRSLQMNAGAAMATGDVLLFLHADTTLPVGADALIADCLGVGDGWGRFDVRLTGRHGLFRIIERMISWRSRFTGVASGDQGMFVSAALFNRLGGYAPIPLMEDLELSRRLIKIQRPHCLKACVVTDSRRWEKHGIVTTVLLMWRLRLQYYAGVAPERLARSYRTHDKDAA